MDLSQTRRGLRLREPTQRWGPRLTPMKAILTVGLALICSLPAASNEPVTVGTPSHIAVLLDLVGRQATLGQPAMNGFLLALQTRSGSLESPIYTALFDTKSERRAAETAAHLAAKSSVAIAGFTDNDSVREAGPAISAAGLPFLSIGATDPSLPQDFGRTVFLTPFGDNAQAAAAAEFVRRRFGVRAAILWDNTTSYTRTLPEYFKTRLLELEGTVVFDASYPGGCDGSSAGQQIANLTPQPDFIYLAAQPDCPGELIASIRAAGLDQPIVGGDGLDTPNLIAAGQGTPTNVWYTTHAWLSRDTGSAETRQFLDAYQAAYGTAPTDSFSALGYDAAGLLLAAIGRAANGRPHEIIAELERTSDYEGVTGKISFSKENHVPSKTVWLLHVTEGTVSLETAFVPTGVPPALSTKQPDSPPKP